MLTKFRTAAFLYKAIYDDDMIFENPEDTTFVVASVFSDILP